MSVHGLSSPTLCQEGGDLAPPSAWHAHTSVPRAVGMCPCVTLPHMPSVLLLGCLGGQGTVSCRVGRVGWPHGSRGKARGVGARRKQACVAQALEQVKMHPQQWRGLPSQAGCSAGCSHYPWLGGPSPQRWGAQHHSRSGCPHRSKAPSPQDPCGCGGGRRSSPCSPVGVCIVPATWGTPLPP